MRIEYSRLATTTPTWGENSRIAISRLPLDLALGNLSANLPKNGLYERASFTYRQLRTFTEFA